MISVTVTDKNQVSVELTNPVVNPKVTEQITTVNTDQVITVIEQGSGGDKNYVHNQILAATTWTVNHNLGKYPCVQVVDSGGNVVIGEIQHISVNQLILTFSAAFSGEAFCN